MHNKPHVNSVLLCSMESDETFAVKCGVTDSASNMVRAIQRVQQVHGSVLTFGFHSCVERTKA